MNIININNVINIASIAINKQILSCSLSLSHSIVMDRI